LSSDHEGLPTVLIEALILHTMVVSTNCESGPSEILIGDLGRYLSRVGDYKSLANKIELAIDNPIEISEKFYKMYDQRVVLKDYENLMRQI
jgi:glycosyltransferase involved in cell wall biosynthesis